MKKFYSLFLILISINSFAIDRTLFNTPYHYLFGNKDASATYRSKVAEALSHFNVEYSERIPVKKMNALASKLVGTELVSFTLFGIWLNEEELNILDDDSRDFLIYHEAAHYALNHHAKTIGILAATIPLIAAFPLANTNKDYRFSKIASICMAAGVTLGMYTLLKPFVKEQEKEADVAATRLLCKIGKADVVLKHLYNLAQNISYDLNDDWHYSIADEYKYIYEALTAYLASTNYQKS